MPFGGVIVNKVHYEARIDTGETAEPGELEDELRTAFGGGHGGGGGDGDDDLAARVAANFADFRALSERDRANVEHLAAELRTRAVIEVPYLDHDVHDLAGLPRSTAICSPPTAPSAPRSPPSSGRRKPPGSHPVASPALPGVIGGSLGGSR